MEYVAAEIPAQWKAVGVQLNLPSGTLDAIQNENSGKVDSSKESFRQVFSKWQEMCTCQYRWRTIIETLRSKAVAQIALADKLSTRYKCKCS